MRCVMKLLVVESGRPAIVTCAPQERSAVGPPVRERGCAVGGFTAREATGRKRFGVDRAARPGVVPVREQLARPRVVRPDACGGPPRATTIVAAAARVPTTRPPE